MRLTDIHICWISVGSHGLVHIQIPQTVSNVIFSGSDLHSHSPLDSVNWTVCLEYLPFHSPGTVQFLLCSFVVLFVLISPSCLFLFACLVLFFISSKAQAQLCLEFPDPLDHIPLIFPEFISLPPLPIHFGFVPYFG